MNPYALFRGLAPYALFRGLPHTPCLEDWPHTPCLEDCPIRPERAEAPSPGQRPGYDIEMVITPCKGKSFPTAAIYFNAFALTGRRAITQTLPRALPWARSFCPFRACREIVA